MRIVIILAVVATAMFHANPTYAGSATSIAASVVAGRIASKCLRSFSCGALAAAATVGAGAYGIYKSKQNMPKIIESIKEKAASFGDKGSASSDRKCKDNRLYEQLSFSVNSACKQTPLLACKATDAPPLIKLKATRFLVCAKARNEREDRCYGGGDAGHREQIQHMMSAYNNCMYFAGRP